MKRLLGTVVMVLALAAPGWAHMGACVPSEVGYNVTVCDNLNRTKCVPTSSLAGAQKVGWIIGRCQGSPAPCAPGTCPISYTVCCIYAGHTQTAGSVDECPKSLFGSCVTGVAEAAKADPKGTTCVPSDDPTAPTNAPQLAYAGDVILSGHVMRMRIVGEATNLDDCDLDSDLAPTPTPVTTTVCCITYGASHTLSDCSECKGQCTPNAQSDGGQGCI